MPKPKAIILYNKCSPETCSPGAGVCRAVEGCTRKILEQEESFETPVIFQIDMCLGCGDCVIICPLDAIRLG